MKYKILIIIILSLFYTQIIAQADPTNPSSSSANSQTPDLSIESYNNNSFFSNLPKLFSSYTNNKTINQNTNNPELNLINSIYDTTSLSSIINPYGIEINQLPDSILIDCHDYTYPTESHRITSHFGIRGVRFHHGIDIGIKYGDTIRTPFAGVIRYKNYQRGGYGNYIIIRHNNGLETIMAHLSRTLASIGDTLKAGDIVGLGGSTGRSTGPHLHLEFRLLGNSFNPEKIIDFQTTKIKNVNKNGNYLITIADTYSHQGDLEEIKRAAYHRVRSGETLSHIARRYGTSIRRLCALNGIKETTIIRIGQKIRYR